MLQEMKPWKAGLLGMGMTALFLFCPNIFFLFVALAALLAMF